MNIWDRALVEDIANEVRSRAAPPVMAIKIVAIDGLGGAGKSTLAAQLARELGDAQIVHTDDFASWNNPLDWWPRLIGEVLEPLSRGQAARFLRTDWEQTGREEWRAVQPAKFIILEGVSASREAFRPFLTYSVWVETDRSTRLQRGLERDGQAARGQWETWMREEDDYVRRESPAERVDRVVLGTKKD